MRGRRRCGRLALLLALALACGEGAPDEAAPGPRRLLVVGIDGASWPLLEPGMAAGELPQLAGLARRGLRGDLRSTPIPESSMAWSTLRTGVSPGVHGVFWFQSPPPAVASYWHGLSRHGLTSVIVAVTSKPVR